MARVSLKAKTLELLVNRPRHLTYYKLAEELRQYCPYGPTITASWLEQFATDRIQVVSVDKVQVIYEYLSGSSLLVE